MLLFDYIEFDRLDVNTLFGKVGDSLIHLCFITFKLKGDETDSIRYSGLPDIGLDFKEMTDFTYERLGDLLFWVI